jgi:hypothetical protein
MSPKILACYRLPVATSTQIGHVRVVFDRHRQAYVAGSKVVSANPSGDFLVLTLANDEVHYVKRLEFEAFQAPPAPSKRRRRR